jgi:sugar lactone lactonase YvrE
VAANLATSTLRRRLIEARALARFWAREELSLVELPASQADFWQAVRSLPRRQAQAIALHWTVVADFSRYLADNPTAAPPDDDFEPDGALYSMLKADRRLFVLEANHGEIDKVDPASGRIGRVLDISAGHGHITPTALARRGGHLYVGNLGSFPIRRGASIIFRVDLDGRHERVAATGLTAVLGLAFDRRGRLYALETTTVDNDFPQPGTGRVVRVTGHGLVPVATGLSFPTGITAGPDGHLYVSEFGYGGDPAAGRILRINPS